jgi:hypothetical protein
MHEQNADENLCKRSFHLFQTITRINAVSRQRHERLLHENQFSPFNIVPYRFEALAGNIINR